MGKPVIRFKGYEDDWEQRKLLGCIEKITDFRGRTPKKLGMDWSESGYLALSALNVKDGYIDFSQDVHYGDQALYEKWMNGNELHEGQVLFTTEAPMGNVAQVPDNKRYILSQRTIAFDVKEDIITENFLATLLRSPVVFNTLTSLSSGGTAKGVSQKSLAGVDVQIPVDLKEQTLLADYFQSLDHLITLHQRKCEQTKTLKKYMLQNMFPQDGEKVPAIRFEGFTDDWEQRKLGDLTERVTRKNQDLVSELPLTISAQYGLIDQNEFFDKRVASKDVSGYYLIKNGEFAYNKSTSSDAPWGAIKRLDRYENGVLSTLYIVFSIKDNVPIDSDFLVSYYSTNLWHKGIHEIAAEGARNHGLLNIAPSDFFETKLMVPQDIEEQRKIGKYFAQLDTLITLHQRKCEDLQKLKKFMLQNMFA
ncbi:MAG: restriction endonuclease subunit S [Lacrimispora saccharolytica]